jgi:O-acetylhomoserine/O-acetylserine sulfhydrylase-like pyridoxal-dependent enzyme
MRRGTISIHGRFTFDPSTKAFAPPIYQNVAYEFGSADHGAALFYDALKLVNIGVTARVCCHSASTTQRQMTPDEQRPAGVRVQTIRLSVGLEHAQDIVEDLDQALGCDARLDRIAQHSQCSPRNCVSKSKPQHVNAPVLLDRMSEVRSD